MKRTLLLFFLFEDAALHAPCAAEFTNGVGVAAGLFIGRAQVHVRHGVAIVAAHRGLVLQNRFLDPAILE